MVAAYAFQMVPTCQQMLFIWRQREESVAGQQPCSLCSDLSPCAAEVAGLVDTSSAASFAFPFLPRAAGA